MICVYQGTTLMNDHMGDGENGHKKQRLQT